MNIKFVRTDKPKAICPATFSKLGGIKTDQSHILPWGNKNVNSM